MTHLVGREGPRRNSRCSTGQSVWEGDVNMVNTAAKSSCDMLLGCRCQFVKSLSHLILKFLATNSTWSTGCYLRDLTRQSYSISPSHCNILGCLSYLLYSLIFLGNAGLLSYSLHPRPNSSLTHISTYTLLEAHSESGFLSTFWKVFLSTPSFLVVLFLPVDWDFSPPGSSSETSS